jgi:hypothetical protein
MQSYPSARQPTTDNRQSTGHLERGAAEVWLHPWVIFAPYTEVRSTSRKEYRRS